MAKADIPFVDLLYKDCVRRFREKHELQFVTIGGMTGVYRLNAAHKFIVDTEIAQSGREEFLVNLAHPDKWQGRINHIIDVCKAPFEHSFIETEWLQKTEDDHRIRDAGRIGWLLHRMSRTTLVECAVEATDREMGRRAGPLPFKFLLQTDADYPLSDDMKIDYKPLVLYDRIIPRVYFNYRSYPNEDIAKNEKRMADLFLPPLLGVLAMINVVPTMKTENAPKGSHLVASKIKPYFKKTKITLELPVKRAMKMFNQAARGGGWHNRRHPVRGHFRTYTDTQGNVIYRKWIDEHLRGDATLGWVYQEHEVVAGKKPARIDDTVFQTPQI